MGFQIKKISNHGTSNPIVARLVLQSEEILGFSTLSKERKESILILLHEQVMPGLLTCDTIARRVVAEVEKVVATVKEKGLVTQAQGRAVEVPYLANLEQDVKQYVYSAKTVMRDVTGLIKIFFGKEFVGVWYKDVLTWARERFGDKSELVRVLNEDQDLWLRQIIAMRDAVEHPGERSGHLHIRNFELSENRLSTPVWHLNDEPPAGIAHDMPIFVNNMLTFCEDLLVFGIRSTGMIPGVDFVEISEADRRSECPKRLKASLAAKLPKK